MPVPARAARDEQPPRGLLLKDLRTNRQIRMPVVMLIDHEGKPRGETPTRDALALAVSVGLDLVEVNPAARPPICRILDYGRYKYDQQKKEKASRRASKAAELKEIRFSPKIDDGDLATRIRHTEEFLGHGHKVKVSVRFRGREQSHPEIARALLDRVAAGVAAVGAPERAPIMEGRFLHFTLVPKR